METIPVELAPSETEEVRALIGELDQTLAAACRPEERHGVPLDALFQRHIRFFLARLDGAAVGCGDVAFFPDFAEVKRMYVSDAVRRRGVAQAVLERLEAEARAAGVAVLRLKRESTRPRRSGRMSRPGFSAVRHSENMPPPATGTSAFYEKRLDRKDV
jgi:putative acetyltransferase